MPLITLQLNPVTRKISAPAPATGSHMSSVSPHFHVFLHFCPLEFVCNFLSRFFSGTTYYGTRKSLAVCTRSASTSCVLVSCFLFFLRGLTFRRTVCDCRVKCGCEVEIILVHIMKTVHLITAFWMSTCSAHINP